MSVCDCGLCGRVIGVGTVALKAAGPAAGAQGPARVAIPDMSVPVTFGLKRTSARTSVAGQLLMAD
jgi:hypothetical protein